MLDPNGSSHCTRRSVVEKFHLEISVRVWHLHLISAHLRRVRVHERGCLLRHGKLEMVVHGIVYGRSQCLLGLLYVEMVMVEVYQMNRSSLELLVSRWQ